MKSKRYTYPTWSNLRHIPQVYPKFRIKLKEALNSDAKLHWIRNYLKNDMKYSFKRGSSRNVRVKSTSSVFPQAIFSTKLMTRILEDILVINIDESSYGRSIKNNYSWLPKSQSSGIINSMWTGRLTLVWALASNGSWMCMMNNKTTTTEDFWIFIFILRSYLNKCHKQSSRLVTVTVDNASIHLTKQTKSLWTSLCIEMLGLPQYWPHLAPCELVFGMTKKILTSEIRYGTIDFSKQSGKSAIINALEKLEFKKALNMWRNVAKISKTIVSEAWRKIKWLNIDDPSKIHFPISSNSSSDEGENEDWDELSI